MSKLKIALKNCYGIGKLEHEFKFASDVPFSLIYAPNGMMKSSLAKTFRDYSNGESAKDQVYTNRISSVSFTEEDGSALDPHSVYVVNPDTQVSACRSVTSFLASEDIKNRYDQINEELSVLKTQLFAALKNASRSTDSPTEVRNAFLDSTTGEESDLELLERIQGILNDRGVEEYSFRYNDVFDKAGKVRGFLDKHKQSLREYFDQYNMVLEQSSFLKKIGTKTFGTEQADSIIKSIEGSAFFDVGHKIVIGDTTLGTFEELKNLRDEEIQRVVNTPAVRKAFDKIDKEIGTNAALRDFKTVILEHNEYLVELLDYDGFRKKVWLSFFKKCESQLGALVQKYQDKKPELQAIYRQADQEQQKWKDIIRLYNARFNAPFEVRIENQRSVLVSHQDAVLKFYYTEQRGASQDQVEKDSGELVNNILSRGEQRAYNILQILFELEARKSSSLFLVLDDIADSFDYKNKYAIVEYIHDLATSSNVRGVILTHNLDFYRTIANRLHTGHTQSWIATKGANREIILHKGSFLKCLLENWIKDPDRRKLLAMLTFVRNLVQYTRGDNNSDYYLLTSCLHSVTSPDVNLTQNSAITVSDVLRSYTQTIPLLSNLSVHFANQSALWMDEMNAEADAIVAEVNRDEVALENKIVLAVVCRIKAEAFMIDELVTNLGASLTFGKDRFGYLYRIFRTHLLGSSVDKDILNRVSLMTPEHIHLNSFMYEPLVDMSIDSLVKLYSDIKAEWPHV